MKKVVLILIVLNILFFSIFIYDRLHNANKIGYVDIHEVFNGFELKKEYEKKINTTKNGRQKIADSLELALKILGRKIESEGGKNKDDINVFEVKRKDYFDKKKMFDEDNERQTKEYDQQIITQLNQYVKDFGKESGYTYILGSDGSGSLMYAKEINNVTKEVIEYINIRYKGIK